MIDTHLLEQLSAVHECDTLSAASDKLHLNLRLYGRDPQHTYVSISDDAAVENFYCYSRRDDEKRYLAWFQALERRFVT